MILAEMEVFHSRPIAPTRRVALGHLHLPSDPPPGRGGLLLGAVVAASMVDLDPAFFDELDRLALQMEQGGKVPQPRLRHRLQTDRVGLLRSCHRLLADGEDLRFDLDERASAAQNVLAAVYAAGRLPTGPRTRVIETLRKAMRWAGPVDNSLVAHLAGVGHGRPWSVDAHGDPVGWALDVLDMRPRPGDAGRPGRRAVQQRFREMLRQIHPDHGGEATAAALRIAELSEARRILLAA